MPPNGKKSRFPACGRQARRLAPRNDNEIFLAFWGGAAGDFLFDIGAEIFRQRCGGGEFLEVAHGNLRKEAQYAGEGSGGMADESHANVVVKRPTRMVRNGVDDAFVGVAIRENTKNLRFV